MDRESQAEPQARPRRRGKLWLGTGLICLALALVIVPPLIGISRYKSRITQLVSSALGRPVRLSGVELRLLPRPGFLLTDLTVEADPAFGAEPPLHANTVEASIRFASLWRGKLQISRISVDEASLNLMRASDGRWNLDSLFHNAATSTSGRRQRAVPRPYLEATNSRINIENGVEKLPFSLLNADAALWQESDGEWRVRLKGQPARTDVSLDLEDTGIVQLEGTLRPALQLNQMPLHVDAEWRDAQLGQLSRLLLGSDEGWRGDLRGELHLDGTADAARVVTRLRATGVHREEFAPVVPIDFDATCGFVLHYGERSMEDLQCSSPVGDGRAQLTGSMPPGGPPRFSLLLDRIPAQAGLDLLRTMRSKVDPSLAAAGTVSGRLSYDPVSASPAVPDPVRKTGARPARNPAAPGPLTGSLSVDGLRISGDSLSRPVQPAKMTLEPAPAQAGERAALAATLAIPAGGSAPLTVKARLGLAGFEVSIHGQAAIARLREFAHESGSASEAALNQLAGEPAAIDVEASGPWLPPVEDTLGPAAGDDTGNIRTNGTIAFRDANWKPEFLAGAVLIHQATLHLENGAPRWDPVDFAFGPLEGTATVEQPAACDAPAPCAPRFTARFGALDAAAVQSALLGARTGGTLLSSLLDRLKPSAASAWPGAEGVLQADSLAVGPFTLTGVTAEIKVEGSGAKLTSIDADLLGGKLHGSASLQAEGKPQYTLEGTFTALKPSLVGALLGMHWAGGDFSGSGKLEMSGYTDQDLAGSAKGNIQFTWNHGGIAGPAAGLPPAFARFDRWAGEADIADGAMKLGANQLIPSGKRSEVKASVAFGQPAKVEFAATQGAKPRPVK